MKLISGCRLRGGPGQTDCCAHGVWAREVVEADWSGGCQWSKQSGIPKTSDRTQGSEVQLIVVFLLSQRLSDRLTNIDKCILLGIVKLCKQTGLVKSWIPVLSFRGWPFKISSFLGKNHWQWHWHWQPDSGFSKSNFHYTAWVVGWFFGFIVIVIVCHCHCPGVSLSLSLSLSQSLSLSMALSLFGFKMGISMGTKWKLAGEFGTDGS